MQIKTTVRHHLTLLRMATISDTKSIGKDVEKNRTPVNVGRNINWAVTIKSIEVLERYYSV